MTQEPQFVEATGLSATGVWPLASGFGFLAQEANHGDLNGDGDTTDWVLHVYDATTGTMHVADDTGIFPVRPSLAVSGSSVLLLVDEAGTHRNGDDDTGDVVFHVAGAPGYVPVNTGLASHVFSFGDGTRHSDR